MKKILLPILLTALFFAAKAQPGSTCSDPYIINSLPFSQAGFTTNGFGNNYLSTVCGTINYISGNEFVFKYVATANQNIRIDLNNIGYGVGIFVVKRCMDDPASECVAFLTEGSGNMTLNSANLVEDSTYYFVISTYNLGGFNPITAFDISVYEIHDYDLSVKSFQRPHATCDMTVDQAVNVRIVNNGLNPATNFPLSYSINGGPVVTETFPGTINPGADNYYGFLDKPDMSVLGQEYCIKVWASLSGDTYHPNDTAIRCVQHMDWIGGFPYTEDFETSGHNWYTSIENDSQSPTSWEVGEPNNDSINTASSGLNAWVTNLTGNNNFYESSYVVSPCMDFGSLISPILEMDIWYCTAEADVVYLEYTLDKGENWSKLGTVSDGGINWYNTPITILDFGWSGNSEGWLTARHALTGLGGETEIQFRVTFIASTLAQFEGFAFDNFKIFESPSEDLGVNLVSVPTGCGLGSESVAVKIINFGLNAQSNFDVAYTVNGGGIVSETVASTVNPGDTLDYVFTAQADLSAGGAYLIKAFTQLPADMESINDTAQIEVYNFVEISTLPYFEDFEMGDGGYFVSGEFPSWQYGTPADTVITHASSGTNCWVTNLSGYHNLLEVSYLTMPCFDFTGIEVPLIEFDIWYETIIMGLQFEASIDGGATWTVVGHMSDPNWYNSGYAWVGSSGNWITVEHNLEDFGNIAGVQFRYKFNESLESTGVGIDNVRVSDVTKINSNIAAEFSVYPNPFSDNLLIINKTGKNLEIKLSNLSGQIVKEQSSVSGRINISTQNLPSGFYYLQVSDGNFSKTEKLVKVN
ncbi:MAG: T9SS type A sorting domain-containing protein [Bacteroidales bacterium]|nr:T9SS type A sorting domain-containing protein [Bacteroidales bacterium]